MNQKLSNLEPGYCCVCKQQLVKLFRTSVNGQYPFYYFSLVKQQSNLQYTVFLCKGCYIQEVSNFSQTPILQNLQTSLEKGKFTVGQPNNESQANGEFIIKFKAETQCICSNGDLKKQVRICDDCESNDSILANFDEQLKNYASCDKTKGFYLAKLMAIEQYNQDLKYFQIYNEKLQNSKNEKEKFYLKQKLKSLKKKYNDKLNQKYDANTLKEKIFLC